MSDDIITNVEVRGEVLRVVVLPAVGHFSTLRVLLQAASEVCEEAVNTEDYHTASEFARLADHIDQAQARIS